MQIVLLCDCSNDSLLYALTAATAPKALLPVANKPILWHMLTWLESSQAFSECLLAVSASSDANASVEAIENFVGKIYSDLTVSATTKNITAASMRIKTVTIPRGYESADALRYLRDRTLLSLSDNFVVCNCDLLTDANIGQLINYSYSQDADCLMLLCERPETEATGNVGGGGSQTSLLQGDSKEKRTLKMPSSRFEVDDEMLFIGLDKNNSQVKFMVSEDDLDEDEVVSIRRSLLDADGVLNIYTTLRDMNLYVFKPWILDLLQAKSDIHSVQEDLIPYLVRSGSSRSFIKREGVDKIMLSSAGVASELPNIRAPLQWQSFQNPLVFYNAEDGTDTNVNTSQQDLWSSLNVQSLANESDPENSLASMKSAVSQVTNLKVMAYSLMSSGGTGKSLSNIPSTCYTGDRSSMFVSYPQDLLNDPFPSFCCRINDLPSYLELNRHYTRVHNLKNPVAQQQNNQGAVISPDSLINQSSIPNLPPKLLIKKSTVVGSHVSIGARCKITASIIMDYAQVGEDCKLDNSIVCENAKIGKNCQLTNCEVGNGVSVPANTVGKNEMFVEQVGNEGDEPAFVI